MSNYKFTMSDRIVLIMCLMMIVVRRSAPSETTASLRMHSVEKNKKCCQLMRKEILARVSRTQHTKDSGLKTASSDTQTRTDQFPSSVSEAAKNKFTLARRAETNPRLGRVLHSFQLSPTKKRIIPQLSMPSSVRKEKCVGSVRWHN